jgi:hypothetical protein
VKSELGKGSCFVFTFKLQELDINEGATIHRNLNPTFFITKPEIIVRQVVLGCDLKKKVNSLDNIEINEEDSKSENDLVLSSPFNNRA